MLRIENVIGLIILGVLLSQCATQQPQYQKQFKDWETSSGIDQTLQSASQINKVSHTMYLLGDAGYSPMGEVAPAIKLLGKKLGKASENSSVIFLGDNIYPNGLRPEDHPGFEQDTHSLNVQLDIIKDFKGKPFIIPGNHDWRHEGRKTVLRQQKYIKKYLDNDDIFLPKDGCSGPKKKVINESLVVLLIDSQWWLADWDEDPNFNDNCDIKSKSAFLNEFLDNLKKYRDKTVIVAIHHPPFTNGSHGGEYSIKDHIFPLTLINKNLYIPLPVLGTFLLELRSAMGIRQDATYPPLLKLRQELMSRAKGFDNVIFVSGHDHNLQYLEKEGHPFVVSGSGSKTSPARADGDAKFTYGGNGFAQLDFYDDGAVWINFWKAEANADQAELIFRKKVLDAPAESKQFTFSTFNQGLDSIELALYEGYEKGSLHKFFWGELHRDIYGVKIKVPVLNLDTLLGGGLKPVRRGGGNQTHSLRLEAPDGRQYVLRSMKKDASRILNGAFEGTLVVDLMRDIFTFSHPYAAFVIPPLADAVGVYHTNPKLYYLPKQPALGEYNELFGDGLFLFEERPDDDRRDVYSFGYSKEIISTPDVIQEIQDSYKNRVDAEFTIRSRLFDMTIGDWDRHEDQWRWAGFPGEEGEKSRIYRPIPRDRDQPFSKFDGLLINIINRTAPIVRNMQSFDSNIPRIKWYNNYGRRVDRVFLSELEWEDWKNAAIHIQQTLTDRIIEDAIKQWPKPVFEKSGEEVIAHIKGRRDNLVGIAKAYYEIVSENVDVVGTNDDDIFEVERLNDEQTLVEVYDEKKGKKGKKYYERIFNRSETKEIHLYGLNGDDKFEIKGEVDRGIKIRIIGGHDEDKIEEKSKVKGSGKSTFVYDSKKGNKLKLGTEGKDKTSDRYVFNEYDKGDAHPNYMLWLPYFGFNPDDGLYLGLSVDMFRYKFKKFPFAQKHRITGRYAFATEAFDLAYASQYTDVFGKWDLFVNAWWQNEQFVVNYFGLGNESLNEESRFSRTFYRVRKGGFGIQPSLQWTFQNGATFNFRLSAASHDVEASNGRFIIQAFNPETDRRIFENLYYGGGAMRFQYHAFDVRVAPTKGFKFALEAGWQANLEDPDRNFAHFSSELAIIRKLIYNGSIVLASQIGAQHNEGTFEFFQAANIGGTNSLRGFRQQRFAGNTAFYHSTDLRFRFINEAKTLVAPVTFGIFGSYDYGRVWRDGESSEKWHNSFGGGIWLSTLEALTLSASLHHSVESDRVIVTLGFSF